jgi:serine/threonine-protein kinase
MPTEGTVLDGKYELIGLLGKGGMGEVWEAERVGLHRRVAVKFLLRNLAESRDARARFLAEAKVSGRIDHDNICEVLDLGVDEHEALYYVMPLLRGEPLDAALAKDAPFDIERACDITFQVLAGLSAAHRAGIVHRDLKPENVFLTTIGDRHDFVKILDFGIAKALGTTTWKQREASLTKTGAVVGTPFYMAPEQARGIKDIDGRVDVYSMGVILYEMLTGRRPIDGESANEVFWNIWLGTIAMPSTHRQDLPPQIEDVVMGAMARAREERYASADDMRNALFAALGAAGIDVRTSWRPTRSDRPVKAAPRPRPAEPEAVTMPGDDPSPPTPPEPAKPIPPEPGRSTLEVEPVPRSEVGLETRVNAGLGMSSRLRLIIGAFVIVGCAIAAGLAVSVAGSNGDTTEEARPANTASTTAPVSPDEPEAVVEPVASPAPAPVPSLEVTVPLRATITLDGVPEAAAVFVDGRRIEGASFDLPRGDRVHVEVRVAGYEPWANDVFAQADGTVPVRLVPVRPIVPTKARIHGDRPAGKRSTNAPVVTSFGEMP